MRVTLAIKNVPDSIVRRLRERARKHHRSLQGELLAILLEAANLPGRLTAKEARAEVERLGLRTPNEAVAIIRSDRDAH